MTLRTDDLIASGLVAPARRDEIRRVAERFSVAVTEEMAALIDPGHPNDPIAAQFLPSGAELTTASEELADPIGDQRWSPVPGIVHRYPDRVLLKPTVLCPLYCRFCFRRETVGKRPAMLHQAELQSAYDYIRQRPEIWEVIVTGGDPFVLGPRRLGCIVRALDAIAHLGVIRFHTRVPIVDPRRITAPLISALSVEKALWVVVHANHPRELTPAAREAVARLLRSGIPVLAQTVLLRGVNDDAAVLEALFRGLVAMRVKPYYLHHADLAPGTSHFRTGIRKGQCIVRDLRGRVSGLCQPSYVLDIPGGYGKVPIAPAAINHDRASGGWVVADRDGVCHAYPPDPEDRED
ncbi:MAG: lysine-2,3-aminomutase-like protein [Alphaproteobacteria bacterium]|nr:lysine-2,3-aminomutase-like protein [Alphaproteobacteria bacterium]